MPAHPITMRKLKDVLRLKFAAGLSQRQIAAALRLSVGVVNKYLLAAQQANLSWPLPDDLSDDQLRCLLFPAPVPQAPLKFAPPDFPYIHQQLKRKGVTRLLLWEEYAEVNPEKAYHYTRFCVLYREWRAKLRASLRQTHRAGEKLFVDYAGQSVPVHDALSGQVRQAEIFVAVLGASNYTYAEATWSQALPDWIAAHVRALEFFGGAPELIVCDNLKAGVSKACRYEPDLNATYSEFATHYGLAVLPTRPYKPRDKAKVEIGVQVVERWILARLRNLSFFSLSELNTAIKELIADLNQRPFKRLPGSRASQFALLEKAALKPLPTQAYEYAEWQSKRVGLDYHIEVEGHYYSVPHALIRQPVEVRLTAKLIEVYCRGKRIASHLRSEQVGAATTLFDHMPVAHQKHQSWTPASLRRWASEVGPQTAVLVRSLLESHPHPEQGYRSCLGLIALARDYGLPRLEAACQRALRIGSPSRRSVADILKSGLDRLPVESQEEPLPPTRLHANVRGAAYYQREESHAVSRPAFKLNNH